MSRPSSLRPDVAQLRALRNALLEAPPPTLAPGQGTEAFAQHKLLTTIVHRAVLLDERGSESQTRSWIRYFVEHFPPGRNDADDAKLLWKDWRTHLLKHDSPGPMVLVTHGQPLAHWRRDSDGRLCIDLESMWADYAASVDHFLAYLQATPERAAVALERRRADEWKVHPVTFSTLTTPVSGATAMASATVGPKK